MIWQSPIEGDAQSNEQIMDTAAIYNILPGVGAASSKAKFAKVFRRMQRQNEQEFDFVPLTFDLDHEAEECKQYMARHP